MYKYLKEELCKIRSGNLLDLGCGNGNLFNLVKEYNFDFYGADLSENTINVAKSRYKNANFVVLDAHNLPFGD